MVQSEMSVLKAYAFPNMNLISVTWLVSQADRSELKSMVR